MTTALIATLALAVLLLWREHAMQQERRAWTRERGQLLNRIKPETAQLDPMLPDPPSFQPPSLEDDEALNAVRLN